MSIVIALTRKRREQIIDTYQTHRLKHGVRRSIALTALDLCIDEAVVWAVFWGQA